MNFFVDNAYIVTLAVTLGIWGGLFGYLFKMDRRLSKMEHPVSNAPKKG
ncbi:MAG: CcmD family protein [Ignavibacteria bacterium]